MAITGGYINVNLIFGHTNISYYRPINIQLNHTFLLTKLVNPHHSNPKTIEQCETRTYEVSICKYHLYSSVTSWNFFSASFFGGTILYSTILITWWKPAPCTASWKHQGTARIYGLMQLWALRLTILLFVCMLKTYPMHLYDLCIYMILRKVYA